MKIQTKASLGIFLLGVVTLLIISTVYEFQSRQAVMQDQQQNLIPLTIEVTQHLDSMLADKVQIARTLATSLVLKRALHASNAEYGNLSDEQVAAITAELNQIWNAAEPEEKDRLLQPLMMTPVAELLQIQKVLFPNLYGEIFLTNRYGITIASTGQLTTLTHDYKYWWQGSVAGEAGVIFLDDRGFDVSVGNVVLGIVVPVVENGQIIGVLKCNILIAGPLAQLVDAFNERHVEHLWLARSSGTIISGAGQPLTSRLPDEIIALMRKGGVASAIFDEPLDMLVAVAPVPITQGERGYSFGGLPESGDQIRGNIDEIWYMVVALDKEIALGAADEISRVILITGLVFILMSVGLAMVLGRRITRPVHVLTDGARLFGNGALHTRIKVESRDEIGELAESFNQMAGKLSRTMASRDELTREVERRKEVERRLTQMATTDELTGAYNRRVFTSRLKDEINRAHRYGEPLTLMMLDADFFKSINDRHGHDVGDQVLKQLVTITNTELRSQDLLTRWGGEEFMIILPHTGTEAATQLGERLRTAVAKHDFGLPRHITVSLGIAQFRPEDTSDTLIKRVDDAMYMAKATGRNKVVASAA